MKLHNFYLVIILSLLVACAAEKQIDLPGLNPGQQIQGRPNCAAVFPQGKWQFVHSINFTVKNGTSTTVLGVTSLTEKIINCALITVEGLTLFEAAYSKENGLEIRRAIPPFDNPRFADGLMSDIQTIFLSPTAGDVQEGQITGALAVCRHTDDSGRIIDVLPEVDDCWQIKSYSSDMTLDRSVVGQSCRKKSSTLIPEYLELNSYGQTGYTLKMTLIRADIF